MPPEAEYIINKLESKGFKSYIVGGCVRDSIMGIKPHDYDITTSAKPEDVKKIFSHTFDTGIKHGTVTVVINKKNYEVTTFRIDGDYEDFRHPKGVSFTSDINKDLLRRDFTMNAIAYNTKEGYIDIFGGIDDIKNKIIRGVGSPEERFREDALRMLRAVRFSAQTDFEIETETKKALIDNVYLIKNISAERIRDELIKLLVSGNLKKIPLLWETGLLEQISKRLYDSIKNNENMIALQLNMCDKKIPALFAILTQFIAPKDIKDELYFYKFDNKTLEQIICINSIINKNVLSDDYNVRLMASNIGVDNAYIFYSVKMAMGDKNADEAKNILYKIIERNDCIFLKQMKITGKDIISMGIPAGKRVGEILSYLLNIVIRTPEMNDYDVLKNIVIKNFINI